MMRRPYLLPKIKNSSQRSFWILLGDRKISQGILWTKFSQILTIVLKLNNSNFVILVFITIFIFNNTTLFIVFFNILMRVLNGMYVK
jgi:hypothetical protein